MRRTFRFDKLVRDGIPDDQRREGSDVVVHKLGHDAHLAALVAKLIEEAGEIDFSDKDGVVGELADLQEVLDCVAALAGVSRQQIDERQASKRERFGSFTAGLYVETVTLDETLPHIAHYLANPDRYPEVNEA